MQSIRNKVLLILHRIYFSKKIFTCRTSDWLILAIVYFFQLNKINLTKLRFFI